MGNVAPAGRRIAPRPGAASVTNQERPPQPGWHRADGLRHLDGRALGVADDAQQLAVVQQGTGLVGRDGLAGAPEPADTRFVVVLGAGELLSVEDDEHLRASPVLRWSVGTAQRSGAQLLEAIRSPLLRGAVLAGSVGQAEGIERDAGGLGGRAVQESGEGEAPVGGIGRADPPSSLLAALGGGRPAG